MNRKKRPLAIVAVLLVLLVGLPCGLVFRQVEQTRKDQALIEAIKAKNNEKALAALADGANGEARDTGKNSTLQEALRHLLDHFRRLPPSDPSSDAEHLPALLLCLQSCPYNGPGPDLEVIRALLDHGALVNDRDMFGDSPLKYATSFTNSDTVTLLLERGAEIEAKDIDGFTPLMTAGAAATKVLLEHGANLEARSVSQQTPLILASYKGQLEVVRLLLEHGANVSRQDNEGKTALDWVSDSRDPDTRKIADLLRKHGAKESP